MTTGSAASVALVHGGFVDGSGWRAVHDLLTKDGFHVAVAQNPTLSLVGDAAAAKLIIDAQEGPVVLVGHSYGGAVISEAGTHPKVVALVYICAFVPDKGESVNTLLATFPQDGPQPPILPPPLIRPRGKANLVSGHHRGPDDSPNRPTHDVGARRLDHRRGGRQSLRLRVAAGYASQPAAVVDLIKQASAAVVTQP